MENHDSPEMGGKRPSVVLKITTIGTYAATCIGAGYMLTMIPNVEIFSMLVFLGGLLFGKVIGLLNGFLSALIYFTFNLLGASPPLLLIVQLVAYTLLGLLGGMLRPTRLRRSISSVSQAVFATIGAVFSFSYLFIADISFAIVFGINIVAQLVAGLVFTTINVICNIITFGFLMPILIVSLDKHLQSIFPIASIDS
jgi:hypothetical protein